VLLALDETSVELPAELRMGVHPLAWYRHVHRGRSFYTALGHAGTDWAEPGFAAHVAGGIDWAAGRAFAAMVADDVNGTVAPGVWEPHGSFPFEVGRDALRMTAAGGANQHLTRREPRLAAGDRYAVDALFTIAAPPAPDDLNSFALNVQVQGAGPSAWSVNLDLSASDPGGGTMKHMGFKDGAFQQIGERRTRCCAFGKEYRLRVEVNRPAAGWLTVVLSEGRTEHERFEVDYRAFPYQPDPSQPVQVGVNGHGADWVMRDFRVRRVE
jgi:hypothetical protein